MGIGLDSVSCSRDANVQHDGLRIATVTATAARAAADMDMTQQGLSARAPYAAHNTCIRA